MLDKSESQAKCALCGRTFGEQQEREKRYIIEEVIDGTSYKFDARDCSNMFKRFRSVYGDDFKQFIGQQGQQEQQQQFISDPFWNKAIPTEQEIREIDKETVLGKPDVIQAIQDPAEILKIGFEIGKTAKDEILILFSTANGFHRFEKFIHFLLVDLRLLCICQDILFLAGVHLLDEFALGGVDATR